MPPLYLCCLMVLMGSSWLCVSLTSGLDCRSEDDWLIIPLITANVLLSPSLAMQAVGGAVELKKTQTTIHQLMDSSYTAGWEGCVWERQRKREGQREGGRLGGWGGKTKKSESKAACRIFFTPDCVRIFIIIVAVSLCVIFKFVLPKLREHHHSIWEICCNDMFSILKQGYIWQNTPVVHRKLHLKKETCQQIISGSLILFSFVPRQH